MKLYITAIAMLCTMALQAQSAKELHETARTFMQQGDYANAVLVLNRAAALEPGNIDITKDLAFTYYLQKENTRALDIIKQVLDKDDADDQCYQVAGNIYKQMGLPKDCEKLYRKALKKFPESGPLYNDFGELLWAMQDYSAIKQWEKGIEMEPAFSKNYYNACKYYYLTANRTRSILYGEIFVNMEPTGNRTPEIKNIVLESFKKLFTADEAASTEQGKFEQAFVQTMMKQNSIATSGITAETLTMIRTRFVLDWYNQFAGKYPYRLFELHRQLLQEGLFDAYNQWLFGAIQNLSAYQNWVNMHSTEYNEFSRYQKSRIFKIPKGQYYP
ncbi:MAG TPA: tetratricopeptide repeat protein [Ferruginibacter sp.]|nr:tetratricopeptide repeat protein [Ferruginibacter sp.]HMP19681.1 tetratricopeptide repeat protein [Ferruginibacter sp.]